MNSIERTQATIDFKSADHVPVIAQVFGHAACFAGAPFTDYLRNGELLAHCQIQALNHYGYDAAFAVMDVNVETEAMGSVLEYREGQYPFIKAYALSEDIDLKKVSMPDPYLAGRMPELLKSVKILRREIGDRKLVIGCVLGPMTLTTQLIGIEKALYLAIDEPDKFTYLLNFAVEVIIQFGLAQIEAGAHLPVVFDPSSSPAVIPPQFFREFELPRLKRVFSAFKEAGAVANWLHIAGPTDPILPFYPQAGVDIANFDYCVDPLTAQQRLPQTCLDGNIKPFSFVEAMPEEITIESAKLLDLFAERRGFILSSGCEIPPEAKPENITALVLSVRK